MLFRSRDLPADEGDVRVSFLISASGRADATIQGPLGERQVGRCLEKELERLRFPAHKGEPVEVQVPIGYRVTR